MVEILPMSPQPAAPSDDAEYEQFRAFVLAVAPRQPRDDDEAVFLVRDLGFDGPSLAMLAMRLQAVSPSFELPPQMDAGDMTIADVHHYFRTMGPDHDGPRDG